jgi:hypothetical protein
VNFAQLRALAVGLHFPDPDTAAAIAMAESGGDPSALGDNGTSYGLWQIHLPAHPEYNAQSLLDANYNAVAAFAISDSGTNWTPWSTYNSGAYEAFMPPVSPLYQALKVGALFLIASVIVAEITEHGGIRNTIRDIQRA